MSSLLQRMRAFAKEESALFFVIQTKRRGSVPVWATDIRATTSDVELLRLIQASINS